MVSSAAVEKAKALINKSETNRAYFFRKVPSTEWVQPLWQAGFFQNPPEGGAFWPESHYLVRVAAEAPGPVYAVVMKIPQTENVAVHRDLLAIATKMPEEKGAKIALRFLPSFRKTHFSWIDDKLCELIEKLAAGSHSEDALALATALLEVLPPSRGDDEDAAAARSILARCRTHLRLYEYGTCTHRLAPVLAAGAGIRAITMFGDLLSQAICFEEHAEAGGPEDISADGRRRSTTPAQNTRTLREYLLIRSATAPKPSCNGGQQKGPKFWHTSGKGPTRYSGGLSCIFCVSSPTSPPNVSTRFLEAGNTTTMVRSNANTGNFWRRSSSTCALKYRSTTWHGSRKSLLFPRRKKGYATSSMKKPQRMISNRW